MPDDRRSDNSLHPDVRDGATAPHSSTNGIFRKEGEYWTVGYGDSAVRLKETKGFAYIAHLLRHPRTEFHVLDLVGGKASGRDEDEAGQRMVGSRRSDADLQKAGISITRLGDAGEVLDQQAKSAYRRRLSELREELEEAKQRGDVERAEQAEQEIDVLTRELSRAFGLGGRSRRAGSLSDRARQTVAKTIKSVLERIARSHSTLGDILTKCIKTGTFCSYQPDPDFPIAWEFAATTITPPGRPSGNSPSAPADRSPSLPVVAVGGGPGMGQSRLAMEMAEYALRVGFQYLVGREGELSELGDSLRKAFKGERQIVFVTGEPGIGKTALADAFQHQAATEVPGLRIARGQCVEGYGGKEAYYPMLEALGQLCTGGESVQILAEQAPTWLVQFPALVKPEQREMLQREILGATRERMLREIGDVLETITSTDPLLLVLEDLQWVDPSTVDLISALARRRAPAKLMLIATKRPVDMVIPEHPLKALKQDLLLHGLCREISLEPLSEAEVAEYLTAESLSAKVPEGLAKLIYHHSEGNPLFIVAMLDHMTEQGLVFKENGEWKLRVPLEQVALAAPEKLRRMIEAQINNLSEEQRHALDVASVAGVAFSAGLCASAAKVDPEDFEDLCEELSRRHHILRSAGSERSTGGLYSARYEFVHALYREVLYRRLASGRVAKLHQRIGEGLETLFSDRLSKAAPELAHHFEQASDWQRAVKYLRVAAETGRRRFASLEAMASLQRALELSSKLPEEKRAISEIEILEHLGMIYSLEYDRRAIDNYEAMASRAAHLGLTDVEARALVGLAYPLMWISSDRCLKVLERALFLTNGQSVQVLRASLRMNCFFYRIWAGGWNSQDAEECQIALNEIREIGDPVTFSYHLAQYSLIQWISSEYRDAHQNLSGTVSKMLETVEENYLNLSLAVWVNQMFGSSSLLFLGEWGEALHEFRSAIAMLDKNGEQYRASALRLYLAWLHLHAMDFDATLKICESSFSHPENSALSAESGSSSTLPEDARISLIIQGSAESGLGNYDLALEHLSTARNAMDQQMVIVDWYWRMQLQSSLTELWLAKGDLKQARIEAERFLEVTLTTAERTWQALAWDVNARIAMAQRDLERAHECITNALSTMEGFEVPLAAWRVHATAAELYRSSDKSKEDRHSELSRATIFKLADSMPADEPLRKIFLSAPTVLKVLGDMDGENTNAANSMSPTKPIKRSVKKSVAP